MSTINKTGNRIPLELQELYSRRKFLGRIIKGGLGAFAGGLIGIGVADHVLAQRKERLEDSHSSPNQDKSYTTRESIAIGGGLLGGSLTVTSPGVLAYVILRHENVEQEVKEAEECLELVRADDLRGGHNL